MFDKLTAQPKDKILALMAQYGADPRSDKIDLGVGVYKDATGKTPVMRAVKAAEQAIWQAQDSKSYVALAGDPEFSEGMIDLVLAQTLPRAQIAAVATPGGTGAIRQGFELIRMAAPDATVWLSAPTWPNHPSILKYLKMPMAEYRYFDTQTCGVDFEGMLADLAKVKRGDVVLLHGCCHNPTGANLNSGQWDALIAVLQESGATPFIDIAYQGFGDGLLQDAALTRKIVSALPHSMIAASCSKNFGIYRERTGVLMVTAQTPTLIALAQENMAFLNRQNFSFPPDHGARIVSTILNDTTLRTDWMAELEEMRLNMLSLREALADALRRETSSDRYGFIAHHRGMFSRLGVSAGVVEKLRAKYGVYMVADSRINVAGLNAQSVPKLAHAIARCEGA